MLADASGGAKRIDGVTSRVPSANTKPARQGGPGVHCIISRFSARTCMSAEIKAHLSELLTTALAKVAPQQPATLVFLERPKQSAHGDYACNLAMQLSRIVKRNPRE